jgi:hypothetical protein
MENQPERKRRDLELAQAKGSGADCKLPSPEKVKNMKTTVPSFAMCSLILIGLAPAAGQTSSSGVSADASPKLQVKPDAQKAQINFLSWDTEGGEKAEKNLLRAPAVLRWKAADKLSSSAEVVATAEATGVAGASWTMPAGGGELLWSVRQTGRNLKMTIAARGTQPATIEGLELVFPLDPGLTPTTVLPADCGDDGHLQLPAIISAPDFGQMLLTATPALKGRLEGSRAKKFVDFVVEIPITALHDGCVLTLEPTYLPPPKGLQDAAIWREVRRGWFNIFQPTARWGEQGRAFSAPPGLLGNNVLSDPCSLALWFYGDQALWTPELAPGISVAKMVRRTTDFWLDQRTKTSGEVVGYWDYGNFLDGNAGPVIAAWDYVEASGDKAWLAARIGRIEFIANYLARRDIDSDGLIEATQSGNRNKLWEPDRSCAWWDAINCGHKDGYTNAIIYRAFRCLADLERTAGRAEQAAHYTRLADALKVAYTKTLYNEKTGWLAWWKSEDGELHDYASPVVNGLAIEYGLVEPAQGREILGRLRAKMKDVGFTRLDLGIPGVLVPIPPYDYLQATGLGCPHTPDGKDTFGQYMNGGISAGQGTHFIAAHYVVGEREEGDRLLREMLKHQAAAGFHNGVRDLAMQGIDWTTWDGKPCGYEGYLADSFRFFQLALLREPAFRERFYRPLSAK